MRMYPTEFECTDEMGLVFRVKTVDDQCVEVEIKHYVTLELWKEIAEKVAEAIAQMFPEEDEK